MMWNIWSRCAAARCPHLQRLTPNELGFDFALPAPSSAWTKFSMVIPPPMFNDIWAMAHSLHKQRVIEGNQLRFWKNIRALMRQV